MKYTVEQAVKWTAMCGNGFKFKPDAFGEKEFVKQIMLADGRMLEATVMFMDEIKFNKDYHCNMRTGRNVPTVHIALWSKRSTGLWGSSGLGDFHEVGEAVSKKSVKALTELTKFLDVNRVVDMYNMKHEVGVTV